MCANIKGNQKRKSKSEPEDNIYKKYAQVKSKVNMKKKIWEKSQSKNRMRKRKKTIKKGNNFKTASEHWRTKCYENKKLFKKMLKKVSSVNKLGSLFHLQSNLSVSTKCESFWSSKI